MPDVMEILNFNIGMLGHVDSGKTSLAKALSTVSATAAFDKNPQSKERGITLDLGFSSFSVDMPSHLEGHGFKRLQYTLVDCPGHASLIRTIIGGAQIIDLMVLVIDVVKGIQTQTAECLIIGEIICNKMLVVFNKLDLVPEAKRKVVVEKMSKRLQKTLETTKFSGCPVMAVAANPGGSPECAGKAEGVENLIELLKQHTYVPSRSSSGPFIFSVDHCFSIRGQGTVMTGTVLGGKVTVNDIIEIPNLQTTKKVKSIQMFRKPVQTIQQGDRAGVCVTQFDPNLMERGLVCSPGSLPLLYAAIVSIEKIAYFTSDVSTSAKFHVTIGHSTVMAKLMIFASVKLTDGETKEMNPNELETFDFTKDYLYQEKLTSNIPQWAVLEFERPIICRKDSLAIGSRFDADIHANKCRLAFKAQLLEPITDKNYVKTILPKVLVYKMKSKEGVVERMHDDYNVICKGLLKKESKIDLFKGLRVKLSTGECGTIDGTFGLSGKIKIRIQDGLKPETKLTLSERSKKGSKKSVEASSSPGEVISVVMDFKRYIYDPTKTMKQT